MKNRNITTIEYARILIERSEKFRDKTIIELTDDEIQEFVELKKVVANVCEEVVRIYFEAWDNIREYLKDNEDFINDYDF